MSRSAEELLEFDKLKEIVGRFTTCAPGRRAIAALAPQQDAEALRNRICAGARSHRVSARRLGTWIRLAGRSGTVARAACGAGAGAFERRLARRRVADGYGRRQCGRRSRAKPRNFLGWPRARRASPICAIFRRRFAAPCLPNGEISDDASPQLKRIRAGIAQAREKIQRSLEAILRARGEPSGEDYITLRNDRFVIPVRASDRRAVPGVVHGASATGQTVFVEPLEAIDLNNRLVQLGEDETGGNRAHSRRADRTCCAPSAARSKPPPRPSRISIRFLRAARFAREFDCVMPEFSRGNSLRLEAARNPVLEATLRPQGRKAVPLSLALGGEETVMVVSGPNTGGKTVSLKTVGLAALSAQSAIPVAAERAELPIFDRVLADIGDEQSIAADLSTFSAHMLNLKSMLEVATDRSLILVDEMGTGTAPEEGAALAVALLEEFRARRALTLATTHHDRLKAYASTTPGIVNAAMEFDEENLRPTYRLLVGVPGTSSGIEIARRLGLPARVVDHAHASLSPESREARDLIAYLHRSRDEVERDEAPGARRTRAARSRAARAADRMGRAAEKAHRRTREEFSARRRSGSRAKWRA